MAEVFDISSEDVYDEFGKPKELGQDEALSQALKNFLTSAPDDYIRSNSGGVIQTSLFKLLSARNVAALSFRIKNVLYNDFTPRLRLAGLYIEPDPKRRLWKITIAFYSPFTKNIIQTPIFVKDLSDRQREFTYQSVFYEGNNLVRFAQDQKFKTPQNKLTLKNTTGKYVFGNYSLETLTPESDEYNEILEILNG